MHIGRYISLVAMSMFFSYYMSRGLKTSLFLMHHLFLRLLYDVTSSTTPSSPSAPFVPVFLPPAVTVTVLGALRA